MPADERRAFGRRFGHGFSQVRVHTGSQAARATAALHARAFALGKHVVLNPGAATLRGAERERLLAHELAHVLQHRGLTGTGAPRSRAEEVV